MPLLNVENLSVKYGQNTALAGFSMQMNAGQLIAVLGANGAGKSSLLKCLIGITPAVSGSVTMDDVDVSRKDSVWRVRQGLVLVPEGRRILITMTVHENLLMGAWCRNDSSLATEIDAIYERFPNLAKRRDMPASVLSGGEQQMLALGRALLARPKILLLDEPSLGLSPLLVQQLFSLIKDINDGGLSIILVEQNIRKALQYAQYAYVLELGKTVAQGKPEDLLKSTILREAYLGRAKASNSSTSSTYSQH